ncbi:MAG TPA: DUF4296 domain-containing protein [Bacteroidia bacterium]|jgi:hypothetical protein|nr:DUF4296 domain-containing protein [Bacteroidia bacterium]
MAIRVKLKVICYKLKTASCLLFTALCLLSSCSYKKDIPPPPGLLDENKMALVISDITLSEAILTGQPLALLNDSIKKINVLKEHGISNEQFLSSMKYYSENPLKLKGIYMEVEQLINAQLNPAADTAIKK